MPSGDAHDSEALEQKTQFPDHFSGHAAEYARYRPDYPEELFRYLAALVPGRRRAWDCATGSGQAAVALARHFHEIVATDASPQQIENAIRDPRVRYRVAPAERSGLESSSVDLVTVAQALHWFDRERFWDEVRRVLTDRGVVAVWCYGLLEVSPDVDAVLLRLYRDIVGGYWPAERREVERGYRDLDFPFDEIPAPLFRMEKAWRVADLLGYLTTWSAVRRFMAAKGEDPILRIRSDLEEAWGDPERVRTIFWEMDLKVGRKRVDASR